MKQIVPLQDVSFLQYERMVVDHWQVEAKIGACGEYFSPDPRFVVFFDGAAIMLDRGEGKDRISCSACFVPAGMLLCGSLATAGYLEHIDIHVEEGQLRRIVGPSIELGAPRFLSGSVELQNLASLLADECRMKSRPAGYGEALAAGVIHEIFHLGDKVRSLDAAPAWLDEVMAHVAESLDRRLTMEELAGVAGMSRSQFYRCFREAAGQPPHQWVMCARIQHAQRLLSEGALLSQVAHDTGFADQAHFSRCFRRATGLPPGQWVKRHNSSKREANVQDKVPA
ncbi:AraC family transcriptional regulator [Nisaea acidiphila]|uniref:AraC family transcriptional regulator n=1 Tax=Nisaea acidiphila TaxID=1862145 RepID=A0A9J7AR31_9PROT|nr:AraC family transcriptional regulator [Nisaea acidiphila]UUX49338.1 AraC family transcriptional regulator [Nisaea acidiphila]